LKLSSEPTSVAKSSRLFDAFIQTKASKPSIHFSSPNLQELKHMHRTAESLDLFASEHWWNCIDSYGLGTDFRHATERLSRLPVSEAGSSESTLSYLRQEGIFTMAVQLLPYISTLIVKLGSHGMLTLEGALISLIGLGVLLVQDVPAHSKWRDERGLRIVTTTSGTKTIAIQHFPAMEGIKVVNVTGAGDSLVGTLLANLVVDLDLFEDPEKTRKAINRAQQAAALTLQSSQAVSPLLSGVLL
jgi:pseudouridine-5'-phosphate glycosidase/pseudouridine kinase